MARVAVKGASKLRKALREMPLELSEGIKKVVAEQGEKILADVKAGAPKPGESPYATGRLLATLQAKAEKGGLKVRVGSWGPGRSRHIHLVEFGVMPHDIPMPDGSVIHHPGAKARPFVFPAYFRHKNESIARLRAAVTEALAATKAKLEGGGS